MAICQQKDVTRCNALHRINVLLDKYDNITNNNHQISNIKLQNQIHQLINDNDNYNKTALLDDFLHIKYNHLHNDDNQFNAMYNYLTKDTNIKCDMSKCQCIQRHYRDRTTLSNQSLNTDFNQAYCLDLISRIHTFCIHSYDINKLTLDEKKYIQQKSHQSKINELKQDNESDSDEFENEEFIDKQLNIISNILKNKTRNTTIIMRSLTDRYSFTENDNKHLEQDISESVYESINFELFKDLLIENINYNILSEFNYWCQQQDYDTDAIIADITNGDIESNIYSYFKQHLKDKMFIYEHIKQYVNKYNGNQQTQMRMTILHKLVFEANNMLFFQLFCFSEEYDTETLYEDIVNSHPKQSNVYN
eukprot:365835_1